MLIVLPFNSKDADLMRRNLAWIVDLGFEEFPEVVLSYDGSVSAEALALIESQVQSFKVHHCKYPEPFDKKWPAAPNIAWQQTASFIARMEGDEPWLWLEADVTPLVPHWFEILELEYKRGRLPFMGHLVTMGGKIHMNGVAIYPKMACEYSINAMRCREAPWDMVLSEDVGPAIHDASELMAHYPRHTGITMSVYDPAVVKRLRNNGAVLFHGCNDGSLIDMLHGGAIALYAHNGKIVKELTLRDLDSEWDEAEAMWQKEAVRIAKFDARMIPWREARRPMASVLDQTKWECGFFGDLPHTRKCVHFNPGLVRAGNGKLWLVTRRWDALGTTGLWASTLAAHCIEPDMSVSPGWFDLDFKCSPLFQMEDARAVWHEGHFWVSHVVWERHRPFGGKQALSKFTPDWKLVEMIKPAFGKNEHDPDVTVARTEKNWVWFLHEGAWHCVYSFSPQHTVFKLGDPLPIKSKSDASLWNYGEIRGGTPPVKVGDEYFTFFHSSIPWKKRQKRYYVGAYAFEAEPPFRVTAITNEPLFVGSEDDERLIEGPLCVFPCGALLEEDKWLVAFGVNDERCAWIRIPMNDLICRMSKVH